MPEGRVSALVGGTGAGETTLLRVLAGLARPTGGTASVLGGAPRQDLQFLAAGGVSLQEIPLYRSFTAEDHIRIGAHLNPRWDAPLARTRLAELRIPLDQRVGTLSGGQRAQVALALTLAKRPRVLLLDEPVAALDPLARRNFLATLTSGMADAAGGLTVVLSSHLITDLERVCDHLILLAGSRVQLCGDIDTLLAEHKVLVGPRKDTAPIERTHRSCRRYDGPPVHPARPAQRRGHRPRLPGGGRDPRRACACLHGGQRGVRGQATHDGWGRLMTWLVWRQYRAQGAIAFALLAVAAAAILADGIQIASNWHSVLTNCSGNAACLKQQAPVVSGVVSDLPYITLLVPAALGMLWGAPLVAHELEARTSDFAWTQSVTRTRWLTVKVGWLLLAAAAFGGVTAALATWWSGPNNAQTAGAFDPGQFDTQGIVPIGYAVFAMALGIAAGTIARRTLPAIAVALGGFIALRIVISGFVRQHYMATVTTYYNVAGSFTPPGQAWVLAQGAVNGAGVVVPKGWGSLYSALPASCQKLFPTTPTGKYGSLPNPVFSCMQAHGWRGFATYQPASRYWPFQGIETGLYLLLAAALIAVTFAIVRWRDAL